MYCLFPPPVLEESPKHRGAQFLAFSKYYLKKWVGWLAKGFMEELEFERPSESQEDLSDQGLQKGYSGERDTGQRLSWAPWDG